MSETRTANLQRISALDQMRGYAIFGMLLVNAQGLFHFNAAQLSHHRESFTYADTIAPLFMFVVGMGMRLSWLRRSAQDGNGAARLAMARRFGLLILIAFALYAGWLWDALMAIGLAGLLALPFINRSRRVRIAAAFALVTLYQLLCLFTVYGPWVTRAIEFGDDNTPLLVRLIPMHDVLFAVAINGGPLGPLSWCMMLLFGTVAYDWLAAGDERKFLAACLGWGGALCVAGYLLHLEWPGCKAAWPFSAYHMTAPFPLWASGLCFFHLAAFHLLCDKLHLRIPTLTSVGMNPLFIYILQCLVLGVAEGFKPKQLSLAAGIAGFTLLYGLFAGLAYFLYRRRIFIKI
jgi:predicted acyltransferase